MLKPLAFILVLALPKLGVSQCTVNTATKTIENSVLTVRYGKPSAGYWGNGIIEFRYKPTKENFGFTFDAFGCAAATYDRTGPSTFSVVHQGADYAEVDVRFTDCVSVTKRDRLYDGVPLYEITYSSLSTMWFEDFFDNPQVPVVMAVYGIGHDITKAHHTAYFSQCGNCDGSAWSTCGTCFINAAGSSVSNCTYNGHFIFGVHNLATGRGCGQAFPVSLGMNNWKPWWAGDIGKPVPNYEMFTKAAHKRWIFVYEGGRDGLFKIGKAIVDAGGRPASWEITDTTPPRLRSVTCTGPATVVMEFDETLEKTSAETESNYLLDNGGAIINAAASGQTVTITTSTLAAGVTYKITVSNVKDPAGNVIQANSYRTFQYVPFSGWADNFDDGDYTGWTVGAGTWSVTSGALGNSGGGQAAIYAGEAAWGDVTFAADVTPTIGKDVWVLFRVQDASNYYLFTLDGAEVYKVVNGGFQSVGKGTGTFGTGTTYTIKVALAGSSIKIYNGSTQVFSGTDSQFTSGKVGFGSNGSQGTFDNVTVTGGGATGIKAHKPLVCSQYRPYNGSKKYLVDLQGNRIGNNYHSGVCLQVDKNQIYKVLIIK